MENKRQELRTEDFNYELPEEAVAKFPLSERDLSKLMVYKKGQITHNSFRDLPTALPENSLLIFNNTKVVPARLHFQKQSGAWIELLLIEQVTNPQNELTASSTWTCMVGNKKKWNENEELSLSKEVDGVEYSLYAIWQNRVENLVELRWKPALLNIYEVLAQIGEMPIPPYLNRDSDETDKSNYQTVYAKNEGAIAAPTAGLHFTDAILKKLGCINSFSLV